ncbi:MAG: transposase [Woronichinia naegeliana WA131]|uniref:Transposase n=1 Tax=Woronichinia naegeliana WA131 TaxID=2824559 RepID=A0A977KYU7_9CYAN|nr:MAG: transposase [Woronichinia naegeliana WA131]
MLEWWTKNFASCELGDERLNNRAFSIGKKLSEGFGKALSEVFKGGNELELVSSDQSWKKLWCKALRK